MPKQAAIVDQAGKPIVEDPSQALAEGRAYVDPDADVYMSDASGQSVVVKGKDVAQAFASGFGLRHQADLDVIDERAARSEHQGPLETGKAALEGNLRGATFGLSDVALTEMLGPEYTRNANARKEAHPLLAPLTEANAAIGTSIGIGAATGGAGGLAGLTALGALEGASYVAGMEISKAALEQRELTADKLLAAAGHGALIGGGASLVLGAGGSALSRAGRSVLSNMGEGASLATSVDAFANKKTVQSFGQRLYNDLSDHGLDPTRVQRVGAKLRDREIPIGEIKAATTAVKAQLDDATARLQTTARELAVAKAVVPREALLNVIEHHATELRKTPLEEYRAAANVLHRRGEALAAYETNEFLFSEALPHAQKIGAAARRASDRGAPTAETLRRATKDVNELLTASADATPHGAAWRAALEDHEDFAAVGRALHDVAERGAKNHWALPSDYYAGGLGLLSTLASGGSTLAGFATAAAVGAGHRLLRDKGPATVARIANTLAKIDRRIANGVSAAIEGVPVKRAVPKAVVVAGTYQERRAKLDKKLEQIRTIRANPKEASRRLGEATSEVADWSPDLAETIHQRILAGATFMEARLPVILQRASLTPLAEKPRIPPLELRRALDYAEALEDPLSVLEDLASGHLPRRKIEVLREVHPELFADLQARVLKELTERETPIPYNRRIMLSLTFNLQADKSLQSDYLARIQQTPPSAEPEAQPQADIDADSVISNLETQTQRLESGSSP